MAKIDVPMPQMGESIAEGTLSKWMKKVGDTVKRDEPIFEISTDKVDAEIPAPTAGVLAEILVQEGQTVAINTIVARIETDASAAASAPAPVALAPRPRRRSRSGETRSRAGPRAGGHAVRSPQSAVRGVVRPDDLGGAAPHQVDPAGPQDGRRTQRRHLAALGLRDGRPRHQGRPRRVPRRRRDDHAHRGRSAPSTVRGPQVRPGGRPVAQRHRALGRDRVEPWSRIRKLTADHMIMSRRAPRRGVNTFFEIDYTRIVGLRAKKKRSTPSGVNLTFTSFIVKAVADNLRKHPGC